MFEQQRGRGKGEREGERRGGGGQGRERERGRGERREEGGVPVLEGRPLGRISPVWVDGVCTEEESSDVEAELRLEQRGSLDSSWRWVGREACRDRAPPRGHEGRSRRRSRLTS